MQDSERMLGVTKRMFRSRKTGVEVSDGAQDPFHTDHLVWQYWQAYLTDR